MNARIAKLVARWKSVRIPLFWQLIIAFAAITLLAGGGVLLVWGVSGDREERSRDYPRRMSRCAAQLEEYYSQQGSWEGVDALIVAYPCQRDRKHDDDERDVAILATVDGTIVAAGDVDRVGQTLSNQEMDHAAPILVDDQPVGLLLKYSFEYSTKSQGDSHEALVTILSITGVVGVTLIVGFFFSRRISHPLANLTAATQAMAAGDLDVRVPVRYRGEMRELAIAFNHMAAQVKNTIVTLRRFVSDAAHEIHTPLTGLGTSLELAPDDEYVERARDQVERLEALTAGLLDLSRIEANDRAETHTLIALMLLVEEASERYASWADQAGLTFDMILPETPMTVHGDKAQLQRALDNLVDNAIKFTPEGGTVAVKLGQEEAYVEISVEDTGIGIPEEDLPHLFGRFHRGRNAAAYPGNGLGLAIVKAIVESHKGQVAAENGAQGAQFTLRLPLAD